MAAKTLEFAKSLTTEIVTSPLNLLLLGVCIYLIFKIFRLKKPAADGARSNNSNAQLPKMKKRDFTVDELRPYDGVSNPEKRILVAVNQKVFDVSNKGKDMYGPGRPYSAFAGRDASRALAKFSLLSSELKESYDDLSDLNKEQLESLKEWELQFTEKYDLIGRLLKPSEQPTEYSDSDEDQTVEGESSPTMKSAGSKKKTTTSFGDEVRQRQTAGGGVEES